jgi:hypothetical protein
MRLLRDVEPGAVRWVDGPALDGWRGKIVDHLNSTDRRDRGRYRYETIQSESMPGWEPPVGDERLTSRDTVLLEKPRPAKPEEPRVVVDQMTRDTVAQWQEWRRHEPDLFWRRVGELRKLPGLSHYKSDEALADDLASVFRKIEESEADATYKQRKLGGGWRGAVLLTGGDRPG